MPIKNIILDVDGVIIGSKENHNFPQPHPNIIKKLAHLQASNVNVSFCTARSGFVTEPIVSRAGLNTFHVTDGGGLVRNFLDNKTVLKVRLNSKNSQKLIFDLFAQKVFFEVYTLKQCLMPSYLSNHPVAKIHQQILQFSPVFFSDPGLVIKKETLKITLAANNLNQKNQINKILKNYQSLFDINWTLHPSRKNLRFVVITPKSISKGQGVDYLIKHCGFKLENTLGVGDTIGDWDFIQNCGFKATLANATPDLKQKISKQNQNSFIGGHVDENGLLSIFKHFNI
ncbi:MAG: HAD hydrolase family protein [Candidatus Moranbacteria bacterium]|nr:HAD hydrolase family protein [Candidatus Moranbacteria bacterium]